MSVDIRGGQAHEEPSGSWLASSSAPAPQGAWRRASVLSEHTKVDVQQWRVPLRHHVPRISNAVQTAQDLLKIADEDGIPLVSREALRHATSFLLTFARHAMEEFVFRIEPPAIRPGPDGSIDIHWKESEFELLWNIPADPTQRSSYYGDDRIGDSIEGTLVLSRETNWGAFLWLMQK